jgi:hypothetical protein
MASILAIVSTKDAAHFSRAAGGYFAGMVGHISCERDASSASMPFAGCGV